METLRTMITFKKGGDRFTFRVAGIVIHKEQILFQRTNNGLEPVFWFLPGGRAEFGESAQETLEREMLEELGLPVQVRRLLFVVENFFQDAESAHHELSFYFFMTFPPDCYLYQGETFFERENEEGDRQPILFDWLPIAQIPTLEIYPQFLRTVLLQPLPEYPIHIVNFHRPEA